MKKLLTAFVLSLFIFSPLQHSQAFWGDDDQDLPADYVENGYYDLTDEECEEDGGLMTLDGNGLDVCIIDDEDSTYEDQEYNDNTTNNNFDGFRDTDNYDWENSVQYLGNENIVQGYSDGNYKPGQEINRAELTKIVIESFFNP